MQQLFPYRDEIEEIYGAIEEIKKDPLLVAIADVNKLKNLYNGCLKLSYLAEQEHSTLVNEIDNLKAEIDRLNAFIVFSRHRQITPIR